MKYHVVFCLALLCFMLAACSPTEIPWDHKSLPEMNRDSVPTGKYYEPHCLKSYNYYTLEMEDVILFGFVSKIKHNKLKSGKQEALNSNHIIDVDIYAIVTDSTNYLNAPREALMYGYGYPMKNSDLDYNLGITRYPLKQPLRTQDVRHGDIISFKRFHINDQSDRSGGNVTYDFPPNIIVRHVATTKWHGVHYCPLRINKKSLFYIQELDDSAHYYIVFGKIIEMQGTQPENTLTLLVKNELTNATNKQHLSVNEIMSSGQGFPNDYTDVVREIRHDQIKEFRMVKTMKSKMKPPQEPAGRSTSLIGRILFYVTIGVWLATL